MVMIFELLGIIAALITLVAVIFGRVIRRKPLSARQWVALGAAVLLLAVIVVPALPSVHAYRLHQLSTVDPLKIEKLTIRDGSTGELRTTTDVELIQKVLEDLGDVELRVAGVRMGYTYGVDIYGMGFHVNIIVRGPESSAITIGRPSFMDLLWRDYATRSGFDPTIVQDIYNSLPPAQ